MPTNNITTKAQNTTTLRMSYARTDQMGFIYYGNYAEFYEIGRTELMRSLGYSYYELEESGVVMPVTHMELNYHRPAVYDDMISIRAWVEEVPTARIVFHYLISNQKGEKLNTGTTTLAFLNRESGRPQRAPGQLVDKIRQALGQ